MSSPSSSGPVTALLRRWHAGDPEALAELTPLVHDELRRLAHRQLLDDGSDDPLLQTTVLVQEAYLRLVDIEVDWQGRLHFFSLCARLMRRVLVDLARRRQTIKRGGEVVHLSFDERWIGAGDSSLTELVALDAALDRLTDFDERKARIVELHCFGGLTLGEAGEALGISRATVERELKVARAWLARSLGRREIGS
ncbi:MAG: ECF-type sigma factor [Acidobacteriota bacterium]